MVMVHMATAPRSSARETRTALQLHLSILIFRFLRPSSAVCRSRTSQLVINLSIRRAASKAIALEWAGDERCRRTTAGRSGRHPTDTAANPREHTTQLILDTWLTGGSDKGGLRTLHGLGQWRCTTTAFAIGAHGQEIAMLQELVTPFAPSVLAGCSQTERGPCRRG